MANKAINYILVNFLIKLFDSHLTFYLSHSI